MDKVICPNCQSHNTKGTDIWEGRAILGPGYADLVQEEKYLCNECGMYFKPVKTEVERKPTETGNTQLHDELDVDILWDENSALIGEDIDDLNYWSGRDVMKKDDFSKAIAPFATKLHQEQQEIRELKQWKKEATELLQPILDYGQSKEAGIPLGESITKVVLERCKQTLAIRTLLEKVIYRHEGGLLPDRLLYNEIKTFLDGTK